MHRNFNRSAAATAIFTALFLLSAIAAFGQAKKNVVDLAVSDIRLGDRASAKKFLGDHQYGEENGAAVYYFYNSRVTSVLKLTAADMADPYFLTAIEVFAISDKYQGRHFVADDIGTFQTESGVFVGFRQSGKGIALAMIVGIPNISRDSIIGPKDMVGMKGEPDERVPEDNAERIVYRVEKVNVPDGAGRDFRYTGQYRFSGKRLRRFSMTIEPAARPQEAKK